MIAIAIGAMILCLIVAGTGLGARWLGQALIAAPEEVESNVANEGRRMDAMTIESHCARCLRVAPADSDNESLYWEALDAEGSMIVCPDCITHEEQQAMDEAGMDS